MGTGAVAGAVQSQSDSSAGVATGTVSNVYDMRGRLVKQTQTVSATDTAETFVTQWAYNWADQVTQVTYPDGEMLTSSYLNGSGLLKAQQLCPSTGTCANLQTGLQYDLALRLKSQTLGNGVVQTFHASRTSVRTILGTQYLAKNAKAILCFTTTTQGGMIAHHMMRAHVMRVQSGGSPKRIPLCRTRPVPRRLTGMRMWRIIRLMRAIRVGIVWINMGGIMGSIHTGIFAAKIPNCVTTQT